MRASHSPQCDFDPRVRVWTTRLIAPQRDPTVDGNRRPGDKGTGSLRQENGDPRHVLRRTDPSQWHHLRDRSSDPLEGRTHQPALEGAGLEYRWAPAALGITARAR